MNPGNRLGPYEVIGLIGAGGPASVRVGSVRATVKTEVMKPVFVLSIVFSMMLSGIGCRSRDQPGREKMSQSAPAQLAVTFSFQISRDLGHGGASNSWSLEQKMGRFVVDAVESRPFPRPGESDFAPESAIRTEERTKDESERFLSALVRDHRIEELENLQTRVWLHPTHYGFEIGFADGHVHRLECVIEGDNHIDNRYRRLVEACHRFFRAE